MKYTIAQQIRYRSNYSRVSVYLQADLRSITSPSELFDSFPYEMTTMVRTDEARKQWIDVVNDAYSIYQEEPIDVDSAQNYLEHHPFLDVKDVFFIMDGAFCIGSVTMGVYKENPSIGGVSRIAIRKKYMGNGLGKFILAYAYEQLRKEGIRYGQSIVMIKRESSLVTHFKLGFYPQFKAKYKVYNNQKRFFFVRARAYWYVNRLYTGYRQQLSENFQKR